MSEPTPAAPAPPVPGVMPEQQARVEIETIRKDREHPWHNEQDPRHEAAQKHVDSLYKLAYPETEMDRPASAAPSPDGSTQTDFAREVRARDGLPPEPTPAAPWPRHPVFDAHAEPKTAADLAAQPMPELSESQQQAGYSIDPEKVAAIYSTAESEDVVPVVRQAINIVTQLVGQPVPTLDAATRELEELWGAGREFDTQLEYAEDAFAVLKAKHPADAAVIVRAGLHNHPAVIRALARIGQRMADPLTDGGYRRMKDAALKKMAQNAARDRDA